MENITLISQIWTLIRTSDGKKYNIGNVGSTPCELSINSTIQNETYKGVPFPLRQSSFPVPFYSFDLTTLNLYGRLVSSKISGENVSTILLLDEIIE